MKTMLSTGSCPSSRSAHLRRWFVVTALFAGGPGRATGLVMRQNGTERTLRRVR